MAPRALTPGKDERILEIATELFVERGFNGVSIPEVARQAKVGLGALYLRFKSKEALGNAVFRRCKRKWETATLENWPIGLSPENQFNVYWARLAGFWESDRLAALYLERSPLGHPLDKESQAYRQALGKKTFTVMGGWLSSVDLSIEVIEALVHGTFRGVAELDISAKRRAALLEQARGAVAHALWAKQKTEAAT